MFRLPDGLEWVDVNDKWKEQDALSKFTVATGPVYIRVRVPSRKKT